MKGLSFNKLAVNGVVARLLLSISLLIVSFDSIAEYYTGHVTGIEVRNYDSGHQFVVSMDVSIGSGCDVNSMFYLTNVEGSDWAGYEGHQTQRIIALVTTAFMGNKRIRVNKIGCGYFVKVDRVMLQN